MIKFSYVLLGALVVMMSCQKSEKETPNGFKYTIVKSGSGAEPKKGEVMIFDFELRDSKDSVWNDSYKGGMPAYIEKRDTSELKEADGITQMLHELKVGDSVKATLSMVNFFKQLVRRPIPAGFDSTLDLTYSIKINETMTFENFMKWRTEKITSRDDKMITDYIAKNNLNAQKDTSGIYIVNYVKGSGAKPTIGNCIQVKYEGKFLQTGQPFDQSPNAAFMLDNGIISGWRIAFPYLAKGDSATFLIPSSKAYGAEGFYSIPPDAVLMFNVSLLDFKKDIDPVTKQCK